MARRGPVSRALTVERVDPLFQLGSIYDSETGVVIPGLKLWRDGDIEKEKQRKKIGQLIFEDKAYLSLRGDSKISESSLGTTQWSLLKKCGALEYIQNSKKTKKYQCTSLVCKYLHENEMLDEAKMMKYQVKKPFLGTHVILKVEYGHYAFFLLEMESNSLSEVHEDRDSLDEALNGLVKGEDEEDHYYANVNCRVFKSYDSQKVTLSYAEACASFHKLPQEFQENCSSHVPGKAVMVNLGKFVK